METKNEERILQRDELKDGRRMDAFVSRDYSGINTLAGMSVLCYILAVVFLLVGAIWCIDVSSSHFNDFHDFAWVPIVVGAIFFITLLIAGAICRAISEIGRTALYQNHLLKIIVSSLSNNAIVSQQSETNQTQGGDGKKGE